MNTADCSWSQEVAPVGQYSGSTMCKGLTIVYQALHLGVYVCVCVCVMDTNLSSSFLVETNTKILYLKWRYPSAAALNTAVKFFWLKNPPHPFKVIYDHTNPWPIWSTDSGMLSRDGPILSSTLHKPEINIVAIQDLLAHYVFWGVAGNEERNLLFPHWLHHIKCSVWI